MGQSILIIGGGASGCLVALHILRALKTTGPSANITVVEPSQSLARGVAYSTEHLVHLLNVPAGDMSAFESGPDHFLDYLRKMHPDLQPNSFVPRRWFGEYLESLLKSFGDTQHVRRSAISISRNTQWEVKLDDSSTLKADTLILAIGNLKPQAPKEFSDPVIQSAAWMGNAWDDARYRDIHPDARVGVLGTGLTMVDVVKTLRESGHRGKITALSRRGLLPQVHQTKKSPQTTADFKNTEKLSQVLSEFRTLVRRHEQDGGVWQDCMLALRPMTNQIWSRLPDAEKNRFLRHLKPYWEVHRHRQPQESVDFLNDLISRGFLQVKAGRIRAATLNASSIELKILNSTNLRDEVLHFDHLINAMGAIADFRHSLDPVISSLQKGGWLVPHHLGLGLSVNENLQIIGKNGPSPSLYAVGSPTKGQFWESTAIPDIRNQAAKLTEALIS
jgi:uncharacterized NAD(P)/FAD-binding protein YdhS